MIVLRINLQTKHAIRFVPKNDLRFIDGGRTDVMSVRTRQLGEARKGHGVIKWIDMFPAPLFATGRDLGRAYL